MEFNINKHWWIIALAVIALYFIISGKGFMGAVLTAEEQTLCTGTGGTVTTINETEAYCLCPNATTWSSAHGCLNNEQYPCITTGGIWNETCVCPNATKYNATEGCMPCTTTLAFCMADFCVAEKSFCLLEGESLSGSCFTNQTTCKASLECTSNAGCSKEIDAPNDCSLFFKDHKITQAGTCAAGRCSYPAVSAEICTSSQLWWQDNIRWVIAGALGLILIIYLLWESGPKRGLFRGKK